MSKVVRVTDEVYSELEGLLQPRETFSEVVERLLKVYRTVETVSETIGPQHHLRGIGNIPGRARDQVVR